MWSVNQAGRSILPAHRNNGTPVALPEPPLGVVTACEAACDGALAVVLIDAATRPAEIAVLDLALSHFCYLTDTRPPALQVIEPAEPEMITYPAGEERHIHAPLYLPHGRRPASVLLSIHGGPEAQERPHCPCGSLPASPRSRHCRLHPRHRRFHPLWHRPSKAHLPEPGRHRFARPRPRHPLPAHPALGRCRPHRRGRGLLRRVRRPLLPGPPPTPGLQGCPSAARPPCSPSPKPPHPLGKPS